MSSWTFANDDNEECRSISITNDNVYEGSEEFFIEISTTNNVNTVSPDTISITINDDDDGKYDYSVSEKTHTKQQHNNNIKTEAEAKTTNQNISNQKS